MPRFPLEETLQQSHKRQARLYRKQWAAGRETYIWLTKYGFKYSNIYPHRTYGILHDQSPTSSHESVKTNLRLKHTCLAFQ